MPYVSLDCLKVEPRLSYFISQLKVEDAKHIQSFMNYYLHLKSSSLIQDIPTNLMMESIILYLLITVHMSDIC